VEVNGNDTHTKLSQLGNNHDHENIAPDFKQGTLTEGEGSAFSRQNSNLKVN
jgi:hypothetical protein